MPETNLSAVTVYSIGHGNRGLADFIARLREVAVTSLVDVRAYPGSKRHPQFTRMVLEPALRAAGIRYIWEGPALGGMRRAAASSPHTALKDPTFRAYADHMASPAFNEAIARLQRIAFDGVSAVMCAERDPMHCHRSFIADALLLKGVRVLHVHEAVDVRQHALRPEARQVGDGKLLYDGGMQLGLTL
jgi:uncharacterized protein (DUF488 family)